MGILRVTDVRTHPTDKNKLRITFSEAVTVAEAETPGNYVFTPSITPVYAKCLAGNLQADLHFGTDIAVDGDTHALWRFDELSGANCADAGPNTYTLTATSGLFDLNGPYQAARSFDGNTARFCSLTTAGPRTTLLGEWTLEALIRPTIGAVLTIFTYAGSSSNVQAHNYLTYIAIQASGIPQIFYEFGAGGTDVSVVIPPTVPMAALPTGIMVLLTIRKRLRTGSSYVYDFFYNGTPIWTSGDTVNCDGGTDASMAIYVGRDRKSAVQSFNGSIDTLHLSSIPRDDAYIKANANALMGIPVRGTAYTLQVSNVSDSATSTAITTTNGQGAVAANNGNADLATQAMPLDGLKKQGARYVIGDLGATSSVSDNADTSTPQIGNYFNKGFN